VREHLEQERLELRLGLVDLVDEQHDGLLRLDRRQKRPWGEEAVREERVLLAGDLGDRVGERGRVGDELADALAQKLRVEQLLGVLPLVERLAFVESLVSLKADERTRRDLRERLRQLGLSDARRPV